MNKFIKIVVLILLVSVTLFSKEIGSITAYNKEAFVLRDGKKIAVHLGMKLLEKDKIITGKTAKLQIIFNDETIITIGKSSKFSIEEYFFEENYTPSLKFGLIQGAMRTITGKIGKIAPQKFKVETKTATIGIRGTNFTVVQKSDSEGVVYCTYGAISVSVNGYEKLVEQGFYAEVSKSSMVIKAFTPKELRKLQKESFGSKKSQKKLSTSQKNFSTKIESDVQIDTTQESVPLDMSIKSVDTLVQDVKQSEEEEEHSIDPDHKIDPDDGDNNQEDEDQVLFSSQVGRAVANTTNTSVTDSHVYLDYENENKSATKMSLYLESSNGTFELWSLYIDKPENPLSKESYTTSFSSATIEGYKNDTSSSNPRVEGGDFKATDDDLASGDAMVWGEWDISLLYDNNEGANQVHNLGGLWVAGEVTDMEVVNALTGSAVSYKGIYKAIDYTTIKLVQGSASMIIDFGEDSAILTIDYSDGRVYEVSLSSEGTEMYGYQKNGEEGYTSALFYGESGSLIGGNFSTTKGGYDSLELKGVYELSKEGNSPDVPDVTDSTLRVGWLTEKTTEGNINYFQYNISDAKTIERDSYLIIDEVKNTEGYSDFWQLTLDDTFSEYSSSEKFLATFDTAFIIPGSGSSSKNPEIINGVFAATGDDLSDGDYMSWGYWNASVSYENDDGVQSHDFSGYWQSGELTPVDVVDALTGSNVVYNGIYRAIDFTTQSDNTINGTATMNVDFGADRATLNLDYDGGRTFDMIVSGNILGGSAHVGEGEAYGAFYGPNGDSIGGNFSTQVDNEPEIEGVYQVTK